VIVLDTHIWLWWINNDERLKSAWCRHIEHADLVSVSAISLFEVSWLEKHGRIELPEPRTDWFEKALTGSGVELAPITAEIASLAVDLIEHHSDPQDRIIIATAVSNSALLLSADTKFKYYPELQGLLVQ
jgi:PIN domain nuclease of toxin-antitoxin system